MTTQEINDKVEAMKAKGCKLSDDKIRAIVSKTNNNSKLNKGFERRAAEEANPTTEKLSVDGVICEDISEYNRLCGMRIMRNK